MPSTEEMQPSTTLTRQFPIIYLATGASANLLGDTLFGPAWENSLRQAASRCSQASLFGSVRFGAFYLMKSQVLDTNAPNLPVWLKGAIAGGTGGFSEMAVRTLLHVRLPPLKIFAGQCGRTFVGFGTFTYLWSSDFLSRKGVPVKAWEPPQPFWHCLSYATVAGFVANTAVSIASGVRGRDLVKAVPRPALMMGVVIASQVSSTGWFIQWQMRQESAVAAS